VDTAFFDDLDKGPFLPPRLGRRVRDERPSDDKRGAPSRPPPDEAWRETPARFDGFRLETRPEAEVFRAKSEWGSSVQPILGEPGAGKSRLLREWAERLIGEGVPVALVPLRRGDAWKIAGDLAARLAAIGAESLAALGLPAAPTDGRRVWLLDGLDEVPDAAWNAGLGAALTALPGGKIITCRTAVFEGRRTGLGEGFGATWRPTLEIQPLDGGERRAFLSARLPPATAGNIARAIDASASLRELAGSPLLLGLMALLGIPLPTARAAFYERAETWMARRRPIGNGDFERLWQRARTALDDLAEKMTLDRVEAPVELLHDICDEAVCAALRTSGLIRVGPDGSRFAFLHPTFQEYHLARRLSATGIEAALDAHWRDPRYEETLARTVEDKGADAGAKALDRLVETGLSMLRDDPDTLFAIRRSPTRLALRLLGRSGADATLWPRMRSLPPLSKRPLVFRLAAASDPRCSPVVLTELAGDAARSVRGAEARNAATTPKALATFARDADKYVRRAVARNASTTPDTLAALARDADKYVRRAVARNASTTPDTLAALALDADADVREAIAGNVATPPEALARDADADVRRAVARNASTPRDALALLARDADANVRRAVARNASTPRDALALLARDDEWDVRSAVAGNAATPPDALARDADTEVRLVAAWNATTTPDALAVLARDDDAGVRWAVARNAATAPDALAALARDDDEYVRSAVAWNVATPPDALAVLAHDAARSVRAEAARNAAAPPDALGVLAHDADAGVRMNAAKNVATPPDALAVLAHDAARDVRAEAARNAAAPPDALGVLAHDADAGVRMNAAKNVATPPEALAVLARDATTDVRRAAAKNAATPPDALAVLARDGRMWVQEAAAENTATPPVVLAELARDAAKSMRATATKNTSLLLETVLAPRSAGRRRLWVARRIAWLRSFFSRRRVSKAHVEASTVEPGRAANGIEEGFWRAAGAKLFGVLLSIFVVVVLLVVWVCFPRFGEECFTLLKAWLGR